MRVLHARCVSVIAIVVALLAIACKDSSPPRKVLARPFLYEVSKDGKTSWLMGTMHVGIDAKRQLPRAVWDRLDRATALVTEMDGEDPSAASMILRTDGRTLEQELGPELWGKLVGALGPEAAELMRPFKVSTAVAVLALRDLPMTPPMDQVMAEHARSAGQQRVYLESAASQMAILDKWFDVDMLRVGIEQPAMIKEQTMRLLAAYEAGDDAKLAEMFTDKKSWAAAGGTDAELAQFLEEMLYGRNAAWIPTLEPLLARGGVFVAVGAGHLVGPRSVVELLVARGYRVERIAP